MGDIRADDTIWRLFHRFGLNAEDMRDLLETIEEGGMMKQARVPDPLCKVVQDITFIPGLSLASQTALVSAPAWLGAGQGKVGLTSYMHTCTPVYCTKSKNMSLQRD